MHLPTVFILREYHNEWKSGKKKRKKKGGQKKKRVRSENWIGIRYYSWVNFALRNRTELWKNSYAIRGSSSTRYCFRLRQKRLVSAETRERYTDWINKFRAKLSSEKKLASRGPLLHHRLFLGPQKTRSINFLLLAFFCCFSIVFLSSSSATRPFSMCAAPFLL